MSALVVHRRASSYSQPVPAETSNSTQKSAALLPKGARPPYRVWLNGVEQVESSDYTRHGDRLVFDQHLAKEGRLGLWNWLMLLLGVRGTYRKNDCIDVQYQTASGQMKLATGVDIEPVKERTPPAP
jgi:hypothetical protein